MNTLHLPSRRVRVTAPSHLRAHPRSMPKFVCRIRRRKGLPLGLSVYPAPDFLDLPSEVRIKIYGHLLVASEPITVCSRTSEEEPSDFRGNVSLKSWSKAKTHAAALGHLTLGLLLCNRQISYEAAATFYRWNTFQFAGDSTWDPLYAFLQMIGENNRRSLRSLELDIPMPKMLWQHSDGTCTTLDKWCVRKVVARPAYEQKSSSSFEEGLVEHLEPAIEACCRILGSNRPSLTFRLNLQRHYLPGMEVPGDEYDDSYRFGLELPTMIEKYRSGWTSSSSVDSLVDVIWHGECSRDQFLEQRHLLLDSGWIIADQKESSIVVGLGLSTEDTMLFTLRWKSF